MRPWLLMIFRVLWRLILAWVSVLAFFILLWFWDYFGVFFYPVLFVVFAHQLFILSPSSGKGRAAHQGDLLSAAKRAAAGLWGDWW